MTEQATPTRLHHSKDDLSPGKSLSHPSQKVAGAQPLCFQSNRRPAFCDSTPPPAGGRLAQSLTGHSSRGTTFCKSPTQPLWDCFQGHRTGWNGE